MFVWLCLSDNKYQHLIDNCKQFRKSTVQHSTIVYFVCWLFSWRYNPLCLYFHSPVAGFSLLVFEVSWSHTTTRHIRSDSSGRVINPSQRPLPDNTQHSQQTNIHSPGWILTHNLSRRAAENLRLRPRGHWYRHSSLCTPYKCVITVKYNSSHSQYWH
jgi:hypothetical protein